MAEHVSINPRYLAYDKDEVQALLDRVNKMEMATDEEVRSLVNGSQAAGDGVLPE